MTDKAQWLPHGNGSRMVLAPFFRLFTFWEGTNDDRRYGAIVMERSRSDRFPTQAEAEQFAVATLRGILEDVMRRLPE